MKRSIIYLVLAFALVLAACTPAAQTPTQAPQQGGEITLGLVI